MTVSGSFDYNSTVSELINDALEYCGKRDLLQTTPGEITDTCRRTFNYMIKFWQGRRIGLWLTDDVTLFLTPDSQSYDIYRGGSHATTSFAKTEVSTAGSSTDTTVEVDSIASFSDSYDADGIVTSASIAGSGSVTLNGLLVTGTIATLTSPRPVGITSDGDDSGIVFTISGTNSVGTVVSEQVTGPNTTEVFGSTEFATVTGITVDGASAGNISIGQSGDHVGVELDDGTLQWTFISGAVNTTLPLVTALTDDVTVDSHVYSYTAKAQKPLEILEARLHLSSDTEYPVTLIPRDEYKRLSDKTSPGKCVQLFPDFRIDRMTAYVWPVADSVKDYVKMSVRRRIDDLDSLSNTSAFPEEWLLVLSTNLAYWLAPKLSVPPEKIAIIKGLANETWQTLITFDQEDEGIQIEPRTK